MTLRSRLSLGAIFAFSTIPTTVLLVLVYAVIFCTVLVMDDLPPVPSDTRGLDLDQAWWDLHQVAARPHPFNSHANDLVRDFIIERLADIASQHPHVTIDHDVVSNVSFASDLFGAAPFAVYQEGSNILVKVEGTDLSYHDCGGYLLSAHFDSVSTGPGATDNAIGTVVAMQMVEHFAKHRPKRTVIFNINNNEESNLNGAHAFLQHPWANISDVFLNLEGAGAGGRPSMFRTTNIGPLSAWTGSHVLHPHANVIIADGFSRGIIRSATDFSVYEQAGLNGLDFAFYRGRSYYHTWRDSISSIEGGKKSLWAMLETTHGASETLANDDVAHAKTLPQQEKPVYFELFNAILVVLRLETLFIINVIFLSTGPILLLLLVTSKHGFRLSRGFQFFWHLAHPDGDGIQQNVAYSERALATLTWFGTAFWSSTKFWVAFVIGVGLQVALIAGYVNLNPFVIHSYPFLVLTSIASLAYLSTVLVVSFPCNVRGTVLAAEEQRLSILLQVYSFTWVLLVFSTVALRGAEIGSSYFITAWNACAFLACVVGLVEEIPSANGFGTETEVANESHNFVGGVRYQAISTEEDGNGQQSSLRIVEEPEPTETTPLVPREQSHSSPRPPSKGQGATGWWIVELLLMVPLPTILVLHVFFSCPIAINQSLTDGNNPASVYGLVSSLALLLVLPMSPFSINIHRWFTLLVLAIFVISTVYTWVAFPFSHEAPLKVYFVQTATLTASGTGVEHITTELTGPKQFVAPYLLPGLPSAFGKSVTCYNAIDRAAGLQTCAWEVEGDMVPSPGGNGTARDGTDVPWVSHSSTRTGRNSALITVQGLNTRYCQIDFTNRRISKFSVVGDGGKGLQKGYHAPEEGLGHVQLWSRDFGKRFEVTVEWKDVEGKDGLEGRVSCGWNEYERATIGGGRSGGRIPSLEEIFQFFPEWAVVSKSTHALFSAGASFSV